MSKDKGTKNVKKAPADKSEGKKKAPSSYQSETKSSSGTAPSAPKSEPKGDKKSKS